MNLESATKHLAGAVAIYVVVAACAAADSRGIAVGDKDASVLDALMDPIPSADAAVTPCSSWQYDVRPVASPSPNNSGDWEPVGITVLAQDCVGCSPLYTVLVRRCAQ
jgi:hypothetical protein